MAADWIKMRGALLDHPKVIAMSRELQKHRDFRDWLCPGGGGPMNGQIVSHAASRAVTTALLLKAWSSAREHGKFDGDDLRLEHNCIADIDEMTGAPGFGEAMKSVGWVRESEAGRGIILPNFKEFNVPMTEAERAKEYRERKKEGVTRASRTQRDEKPENVTTREEKRRTTSGSSLRSEPAADPVKEEIWKTGRHILTTSGLSIDAAGSFLGGLCKDYGQKLVLEAVRDAAKATPAEPRAWLAARCQERRAHAENWMANDESIQRKGVELGLHAKPGETMGAYRDRIKVHIHNLRRAA